MLVCSIFGLIVERDELLDNRFEISIDNLNVKEIENLLTLLYKECKWELDIENVKESIGASLNKYLHKDDIIETPILIKKPIIVNIKQKPKQTIQLSLFDLT